MSASTGSPMEGGSSRRLRRDWRMWLSLIVELLIIVFVAGALLMLLYER